jgi:hypothetical protein
MIVDLLIVDLLIVDLLIVDLLQHHVSTWLSILWCHSICQSSSCQVVPRLRSRSLIDKLIATFICRIQCDRMSLWKNRPKCIPKMFGSKLIHNLTIHT